MAISFAGILCASCVGSTEQSEVTPASKAAESPLTAGVEAPGEPAPIPAAAPSLLPRFPQLYGWRADTVRNLYRRWQDAVVECVTAAGYSNYVRFPTPEGDLVDVKYDDMDREAISVRGFRPPTSTYSVFSEAENQAQSRVDTDPAFAKAIIGSDTPV